MFLCIIVEISTAECTCTCYSSMLLISLVCCFNLVELITRLLLVVATMDQSTYLEILTVINFLLNIITDVLIPAHYSQEVMCGATYVYTFFFIFINLYIINIVFRWLVIGAVYLKRREYGELIQPQPQRVNIVTLGHAITIIEEEEEVDMCSICHDDYSSNEMNIELSCKHRFHQSCFITWYRLNHICPVCRHEIN